MYEQIGERYGVDVVQVSESTMEMLAGPGYELREAYDQDLKAGSVLLVEAEYLTDGRLDFLRIVDSAWMVRNIDSMTFAMCMYAFMNRENGCGDHYEVWQVMDDEVAYVGDIVRLSDILVRRVFDENRLAKAS